MSLVVGAGVSSPGDDCDGVILAVVGPEAAPYRLVVAWESGMISVDAPEAVAPLGGALAGSPDAARLREECLREAALVGVEGP